MQQPAINYLSQIRHGEMLDELAEHLADLTNKCAATGKKGVIKLALTIKPGQAGQLEITDDITCTPPKPVVGTTLVFGTPEGNWSRNDPRQAELPNIRSVQESTPAVRSVG